ncbi:MAG: hypothetical protein ABWZ74_11745 [Hyphomicrobiaceae bacterium]|jgi:hypothetical protein
MQRINFSLLRPRCEPYAYEYQAKTVAVVHRKYMFLGLPRLFENVLVIPVRNRG